MEVVEKADCLIGYYTVSRLRLPNAFCYEVFKNSNLNMDIMTIVANTVKQIGAEDPDGDSLVQIVNVIGSHTNFITEQYLPKTNNITKQHKYHF